MTKLKGITKSGGRKHELDKFYTKPEIAELCLKQLNLNEYDEIIEPSAGAGSFSNIIPNVTAYDIAPEAEGIIEQNWFDVSKERKMAAKTLVVGNPPFGENNKLAIQFINHSALFADDIAFILPLSFMKESIQKKIDANLHLSKSLILPKKSFLLNGEELDVPSVFQIWTYKEETRINPVRPTPVGFKFVPKTKEPDLYLQRIGGNAGNVGLDWENRNIQSNYFIKVHQGVSVDELLEDFRKLRFPYRDYGVGPRSISKKEVLLELKELGSKFVE